ncbi:MAG: hypothetical protein JSW11_18260 [Candidatus Heimdallarchaeota archaeon]|nr:MAG: hypothetical protein JSW11_18260 [Candidatus Heimdallarchaeota archaeon]
MKLSKISLDDDTVLTSFETPKATKWSSSFRPHGAYVDELRFVIYNSTEIPQAMSALRNGELDAYDENVQIDYLSTLVRDENIDVTFTDSMRYQALILNCGRFPTNITAFRRALAFGFSKYMGRGYIPEFPPPLLDSYIPWVATEWQVESEKNDYFFETDYVSGNRSMENAGFIDLDGDGWREYDTNDNGVWDPGVDIDDDDPNFVVDIYAIEGYFPATRACQEMQSSLTNMGIHSNVVEMNFRAIIDKMKTNDYWITHWIENISVIEPAKSLYDRFRTGASKNQLYYHFCNATIDAILDNMTSATSLEDVKTYAHQAGLLLVFEQPQLAIEIVRIINAYRSDKFEGFFTANSLGSTCGDNWAAATKVHLKDSLGGPLGGMFNYCLSSNMETWNPYVQNTVYENTIFQYIYEPLWNFDPNTWDPIPGLAYDWDIEQTTANGDILDGQKFTFHLYENETWHDGEPFTAADVNHSMHMWRDSSNHGPKMWDIYKVEIPDDYTIEFYVNKTGYFEWADTTSFYITPEHIWRDIENVTAYSPTITEVIGTGPYKLDTWVPDDYISLLRHEDWRWDIREVLNFSPSTAYIDTITTSPTYSDSTPTTSLTHSSISSAHSDVPLDILPILQFFELGTILFFVVTLVIIVRRQRMG